MQLLLKNIKTLIYVFTALLLFVFETPVYAIEESEPLHFSADKQIWDRRNNKVELIGHAVVSQLSEKLNANHAVLDLTSRTVDATGDCVYVSQDVVINSDEMHFNLDTHTGTIVGGRVSHERFTLSGERINKLGDGRFQTHWGEYSTCRDCPRSWAFQARDVDLELGGYAYITDVTAKFKDAPAFWAPYMILPLKTKRQSGLLFPRIQLDGTFGFVFVQPYFWAIGRSADMTLGLGTYTEKGRRVEWEGRYALSPKSGGQANFYHIHDERFKDRPNRWSFALEQTQEFSSVFGEKFRLTEVSDNLYPLTYLADSNRGADLVLRSDIVFNYGSSDVSAYILGTRYRNVFPTNPPPDLNGSDLTQQKLDFDPKTVQVLPRAVFTTNDKPLLGSPLMGGLTLGISNFTRTGDAFDHNFDQHPERDLSGIFVVPPFRPGIDPLRKSTRFSASPSLYTTLRPFDIFSIVPSAKYQSYFYSFHTQNGVPNLFRGYLLTQVELNAQLERIYDFPDDPVTPRAKHLIRPNLTYSRIPFVREDQEHPFMRQISVAKTNKVSGYYFDNYDVVPIRGDPFSNNYFVPLG
ncbi:MAG: LPS assembly protein LptD, partial [Bdellovibrionota bacterium]